MRFSYVYVDEEHNAIAYHKLREAVAAGLTRVKQEARQQFKPG
jgi:hypothetical protein